ncbi:MAG: efflux RND transporter permease subunit [Proteobacteria bacterium]|jgi:HAE1 family hydrophobic/amphiphilic exporter-1|nr:efflux RND transporter permease subunit [Pseudomonadota bacterium]MDA1300111.1 efflux RND transporter permease subunit [Pseudomonadota bacterium]
MVLSHAAIRRPVTVVMFFIGLAIIGIFSAFKLAVEQFPEQETPYVSLGINLAGTSSAELEQNVTRPVEEVLSTMSGVERMFTFTRPGAVHFNVQLNMDGDVMGKGIEAKDLIEGIRHRLPDDVRQIQLRQYDPNTTPVYNVLIVPEGLDMDHAFDVLDVNVRAELERLPGVQTVNLYGILQNYVRILLDPGRVAAYDLDYRDIQARLQSENFFVSAGKFETERREFRVRPLGQFETLDDIRNLPINSNGLKISDIAEVVQVPDDDFDRRRVNGVNSLGVSVFKRPEANLVEVSRAIEAAMQRIKGNEIFANTQFHSLDSQAETIIRSLKDLRDSGFIGGLLSVMVLFLFLRDARVSILIASTVPLALCATLGLMYFLDMTLNTLSLVGLMLTIGLLVDNSVVVSEAIAMRRRDHGISPREAADRGVSEVGMAIVAGTLTTVIVFIPSFMSDMQQIKVMQTNIAIPLCTALIGSLLVAQTLVPTVMARMPMPLVERRHPLIEKLSDVYERGVRFSLAHRLASLIVVIGIGASGWYAYQQLEVDMNPEQESSRLELSYYIRGTMEIEFMEEFVGRVEAYLLGNKEKFEIENIFTEYDTDRGKTIINLIEGGKLAPGRVEEMIMANIPELPKIRLRFSNKRRGWGGGGDDRGLSMRLVGSSTAELVRIGDDIVSLLERNPVLKNVQHDGESSREEVQIRLRPEQAGALGVDANTVSQAISVAIGGRSLRRGFIEDGRETQIFVELEGKDEANINTIRNLPIFLPQGGTVPLETVADIVFDSSISVVRRENRETSINVNFATAEGPPMMSRGIVEGVMENYELPPGYRWEFGRGYRFDQDMFSDMAINIAIAVLLIYMLMAALFESLLFPTTVIIAIVFSVVGACWTLYLTGTTLTSMALTGMLLLAGIVVNNGIVLLNRILQLRNSGVDRLTAIVESGRHRLRPILMTVCTTTAGMLPLAVGEVRVGGEGPAYFPMARTLIGGLLFSTVITLLILPLIYVLFDDIRNAWQRFWLETRRRAAGIQV